MAYPAQIAVSISLRMVFEPRVFLQFLNRAATLLLNPDEAVAESILGRLLKRPPPRLLKPSPVVAEAVRARASGVFGWSGLCTSRWAS